jgi:hypothetical protein
LIAIAIAVARLSAVLRRSGSPTPRITRLSTWFPR